MSNRSPRAGVLYLAWVGTLCGALLLLLSEALPVRLAFVRPEALFVCLTEVEVAFVLFAWPAFIPSLVPPGQPVRLSLPRLLADAGVLLVAALPLELIAANVSDVTAGTFFRATAAVAALAAFGASVMALGAERGWRVGPWLVLAAFVLSAVVPFAGFLAWTRGEDPSWLTALSPFWAASRPDANVSLGLVAIFGGLAAAVFGAGIATGKRAAR